jgi:hypothetical protein
VRSPRAALRLLVLLAALAPGLALAQLGSLVVTMTAPDSGVTVSGSVAVSASVTILGAATVVGVQFKLDGANLGAEDTSAPYSIAWNTVSAANGSHTLTAVARDFFGVHYTSQSVTVTVFNDKTPPSVSISSPAGGATIAGTVTVSATASDNVGVVGVQFKLDGANLGGEDTGAPYSVSWSTAGSSDGSHTLTAVARDAAGNSRTSAPVTVTVANAPPPPPPPAAVQRFEETDPAVAFSAGWSAAPTRTWSGGGAAATTAPAAQASFTFTGTSVGWVGGRAPSTGIARVSVDGVFIAEVDTFSRTEEIRVPMFGISGLASGSHTLSIEATGRMNPEAAGTLIVVDAFDVPAPATSRLQDTDPSIAYGIGWMAGDPSRAWSGGTATLASLPGAQATLSFNGTAVSWIGAKGPQLGIASVSLDGAAPVQVDTYAPAEQIQAEVFRADNLADTSHTLSVQASGLKNGASSDAAIVIDGFEVTAPGVRVQETNAAIAYSAGWIPDNRDKAYSEGISAESNTTGAQATFTFVGTGVRWIGARGPQTGTARVFLDGVAVADIDTFALTEGPQHTDFAVTGLARTTHTLTVQVTGKNPAATNAWILIDAFDVVP